MKRVLGSMLLVWFAAISLLGAEPYRWQADATKEKLHTNETAEVSFTCRFEDAGALYVIDFQPPLETEAYRLVLLGEEEVVRSGRRVNSYRYLFYAKRSGTVELPFVALMRKTSRESIENTVIGRDNVEDFEFVDTRVALPKLLFAVKDAKTPVVGEMRLSLEHSKTEVKAFEPVQLKLVVEGSGNFEELAPFSIDLPGVEVFAEAPEHDYRATAEGYKGRYVQQFALVAEQTYTIPSFELRYFNTASGRLETLTTEALPVDVLPGYTPEALLDAETPEVSGWRWEWAYLYYLLAFLAGAGIGRWSRQGVEEAKSERGWKTQLKAAKDVEGILVLLVLSGDLRYRDLIAALEAEGEGYGVGRAKKEALRLTGE